MHTAGKPAHSMGAEEYILGFTLTTDGSGDQDTLVSSGGFISSIGHAAGTYTINLLDRWSSFKGASIIIGKAVPGDQVPVFISEDVNHATTPVITFGVWDISGGALAAFVSGTITGTIVLCTRP